MIDRTQIEERLKNLTEQRELQRRRLLDYQAALRATEQACQQLEGAIVILQDVLGGDKEETPCPASPPNNGDSSGPS